MSYINLYILTLHFSYADVGSAEQCHSVMPSAIILHSCNSLPAHLVAHFARLHNTYFSLSMGGGAGITDKVVALVRNIPPQRLLLETDSPDQLPVELRRRNTAGADAADRPTEEGGSTPSVLLQYNEPALLQHHCRKLSEALDVSYLHLAAQTYENTCRAFGVHT
jgi:Tat protein secretion system quality control protein TatD with DNase activity